MNGNYAEEVNYQRIIDREGYHCYICNQDILPHHKLAFDHFIPLLPRNGDPIGTHTEDNLYPTHRECNARKSNRKFEDLTDFDKRGPDN
jgi:5-methylcytosine-specific restriction endonuclease McrA